MNKMAFVSDIMTGEIVKSFTNLTDEQVEMLKEMVDFLDENLTIKFLTKKSEIAYYEKFKKFF